MFLPITFGEKLTSYLPRIVLVVLKCLADEASPVRNCSLRIGQIVARNFANSAVDLLMPELEVGIFNPNCRIRHSPLQLLGDLLFKIAGLAGKIETAQNLSSNSDDAEVDEEEEDLGTDSVRQIFINALGIDKFRSILSIQYGPTRLDQVRQAALFIWKAILNNTPRTIREFLPTLISLVLSFFSHEHEEIRGLAARTLEDLVQKLGQGI